MLREKEKGGMELKMGCGGGEEAAGCGGRGPVKGDL